MSKLVLLKFCKNANKRSLKTKKKPHHHKKPHPTPKTPPKTEPPIPYRD